jgi:hypothetical protein
MARKPRLIPLIRSVVEDGIRSSQPDLGVSGTRAGRAGAHWAQTVAIRSSSTVCAAEPRGFPGG